MRAAGLGFLMVVAGLVIAAVGAAPDRQDCLPPRAVPVQFYPSAANSDLITVSANVGDKYQQLTVIDPKRRVMSVYHIEFATGKIALRSVRDFHFDLQLKQFNGKDPLPEEIQALLPAR